MVGWRTYAAAAVAACCVGFSTVAAGAELSVLPPDQQAVVNCMFSVVAKTRNVTDPHLRFAGPKDESSFKISVFIDYTYHHRTNHISPQVGPQEIDITDLLLKKETIIVLNGIMTDAHDDLNDADGGMFGIIDGWNKQCGLHLGIITV
jgi:hypothetical protein